MFPSPLPIRLCNILKIPLTGIQFPFFPLYTLLAMGSDKNNWNFLRSTLVTLRASSYSPLYDIKNQDNLLKQGEQLHTNCFMKVSKINFYSDDNMKHDYVVFPGFELTGHITKTLYADEISCGLRCLQDEKCQSYNSKSDVGDENQVRKTWGVTHVLLIMEEVLLSKVLNIMETLVEVGGGVWKVGVFWLSQ